jgi:hypothetical protein
MVPVSELPVDARFPLTMKARIERAVEFALAVGAGEGLRVRRDNLAEENLRLKMELVRVSQENDALRASIEIWIRTYENQLARANRAVSKLLSLTGELVMGAELRH